MSRGINKVILIGNLGQNPEFKKKDEFSVANFSIATSDFYKGKTSGKMEEITYWHRIVCFGRLSEIAQEYLTKGSKIYVEGKLQYKKWVDKDGQEKTTPQILAEKIQMLDSKKNSSENEKDVSDNVSYSQSTITSESNFNFDEDVPF